MQFWSPRWVTDFFIQFGFWVHECQKMKKEIAFIFIMEWQYTSATQKLALKVICSRWARIPYSQKLNNSSCTITPPSPLNSTTDVKKSWYAARYGFLCCGLGSVLMLRTNSWALSSLILTLILGFCTKPMQIPQALVEGLNSGRTSALDAGGSRFNPQPFQVQLWKTSRELLPVVQTLLN